MSIKPLDLSSSGIEFHSLGAPTANSLSPYVFSPAFGVDERVVLPFSHWRGLEACQELATLRYYGVRTIHGTDKIGKSRKIQISYGFPPD